MTLIEELEALRDRWRKDINKFCGCDDEVDALIQRYKNDLDAEGLSLLYANSWDLYEGSDDDAPEQPEE